MNGVDFQEFDDASFTQFRRHLLRAKWGGEQHRAFLRAVRNGEDFLRNIRAKVDTQGSLKPPLCPDRLTESEFKQPPGTTEEALYKAWSSLTPRVACRTSFWANLTCRHIEHGRIQAAYLAGNGGGGASGAQRIDRLLHDNGDSEAQAIRTCVLDVLRRLGGIREYRGNRSVYVNCPFARAWWRERLVSEVSGGDPELADKVREVVTRVTQTYWEELVVLVVSRNSVLGSSEVRNQFILSLAELFERYLGETPLRVARRLRATCQAIGVIQASRELSVLEVSELRELMDEVIEYYHNLGKAGGGDG